MKKFMVCMLLTALTAGLCACGAAGSYAAAPGSAYADKPHTTVPGESAAGRSFIPVSTVSDNSSVYARARAVSGNASGQKPSYTQAEYDFVVALKLEGYASMKVEDYNKKVLDWEDEDNYHKAEDTLHKVFYSLPEDDPNRDFIRTTLYNTWEECSSLHYNACHRQMPTYSGAAIRETYGDVYGEPLLITGAYSDFWFDYEVTDGKSITIAQRDSALNNIEDQMQKYLDQCSKSDLKNEKAMEKNLKAQLEKLLKAQTDGIAFGSKFDVDYCWNQPGGYDTYGNDDSASTTTSENDNAAETYTKKQYDSVISALKPSGYESLSISEFNRMVYNALYGNEVSEELPYAYEMVAMYIKDNDANADFLRKTVPRSLNEYEAKVREVYSGKTVDPEYSDNISISHMEDVFGDKVETGECYTDYTFTYRITTPEKLTVKERDKFINDVTAAIRESLDKLAADKMPDKAQTKAAIEAAGKTVNTDNIQFTGCNIEYFEAVPYN